MSLSNLEKQFSPKMVQRIQDFGLPYIKVGAVVQRFVNGMPLYLCVHEAKVKVNGVWQVGDGGWNIPSGSLDYLAAKDRYESLTEAIYREVREETGQEIFLEKICSISHRADDNNPYILVCVLASPMGDIAFQYSTEEISEIAWKSRVDLERMMTEGRLRNAEFMMTSIHNIEKGIVGPLSLLNLLTPKSL